tara:strand:+ start:9719 stop:10300 length:582 start_codon:yes stop_codon:yes gene_type:complete
MKYYVNFAVKPVLRNAAQGDINNQTLYALNPNFRMPQAPMYQQDGVYNQMCKYRLVNLQFPRAGEDDLAVLNGQSLILRFRNVGTRNQFNLFNSQGAGAATFNGGGTSTPLEFHIRCGKQIYQNSGGAAIQHNSEGIGDTSSVELIGPPMWGEVPEIVLYTYYSAGSITDFDPELEMDIVFTLEIEPIYSKTN